MQIGWATQKCKFSLEKGEIYAVIPKDLIHN